MYKIGDMVRVMRRAGPRRGHSDLGFVTDLLPPSGPHLIDEVRVVVTYLKPYVSWNGTLVAVMRFTANDLGGLGVYLVSRPEAITQEEPDV